MIDIKDLVNNREKILQEAEKIGISQICACKPLYNTLRQCFLVTSADTTTQKQLNDFGKFIKKLTNFDAEIILFDRSTFPGLMDTQSDEIRPAFQSVLDSAKSLQELDMRPLQEQLDQQEFKVKTELKVTTTYSTSQQLATSMLFIKNPSDLPLQKLRKRKRGEELKEKVINTDPNEVISYCIDFLIKDPETNKELVGKAIEQLDPQSKEELLNQLKQSSKEQTFTL